MASPEENLPDSGGRRKLQKRRALATRPSIELPERLREVGPDVEDDVTAPRDRNFAYMNQSLISLVTRTGTYADYQSRFDDDSSSEGEGEQEEDDDRKEDTSWAKRPSPGGGLQATVTPERGRSPGDSDGKKIDRAHKRKLSENRLVRSLGRLRLKPMRDRRSGTSRSKSRDLSSSQLLSPRPSQDVERAEAAESGPGLRDDVPVLSRMLKAQADLEASMSGSGRRPTDAAGSSGSPSKGSVSLAQRLMEIFGFREPDEVIAEYPCWLLQSVLLQGYMYITQRHVCFYAYLPKKNHVVAKSGYLAKRGKQNPRYNRYWFVLKGDVLSYYPNQTDKYFQSGNIDLRYGISATVLESNEKGRESTGLSVTTHQRTYYFKADSATSAKEWVKQLQKVIFRSHNDGDSVKICLPIDNIIDLEESKVIGFADTVKIRVFDNDETYAVDEYFFSFFSFAQEAIGLLKLLVDENELRKAPADVPRIESTQTHTEPRPKLHVREASHEQIPSPVQPNAAPPQLRENVRATLAPTSPRSRSISTSRASGESVRSSFDATRPSLDPGRERGRASFDRSRSASQTATRRRLSKSPMPIPSQQEGSADSISNSLEPGTESSAAIQSIDESNASASQILNRSDVFEAPTIQHAAKSVSKRSSTEHMGRRSQDTTPSLNIARPPQGSTIAEDSKGSRSPSTRQAPDAEDENGALGRKSMSTSTLRDIVNAGAYPLQRASGLAGAIKNQTQRMSHLLATRPMGYYEKVSGMWAGGKRHYGKQEGPSLEDEVEGVEDEEEIAAHERSFREHFGLPDSEKLLATYFGYLQRVLPLYGKMYVGTKHFCFRSLLPGTRTKLILPFNKIETVAKENGFRFGYHGLVVIIRAHEELFFEFGQGDIRDDCAVTLHHILHSRSYMDAMDTFSEAAADAEAAKAEHYLLQEARKDGHDVHDVALPKSPSDSDCPPIFCDDPRVSILDFKPPEPLRVTCLTIGSRGDVQPYIALCKRLQADGHTTRIATHAEFESFVREHGIDFAVVSGDPAELMRICVDNGMFTYSFMKEATTSFRGWLDGLCITAWAACQDTDLLIESPSAMVGIHIAEALEIPYFRAFTMPWTRTRSYPHAFAVPNSKMGGAYNYLSYVVFETMFWKASASQINRFRKKTMGLGSTSLDKMQPNKVPFLYNFSPAVVAPPVDYSDWIRVTGYWFLDQATGWEPDDRLAGFVAKARAENQKLVYIGFGSITVNDRLSMVEAIATAVEKADVRCIWASGWSGRGKEAAADEPPLADLAALLPPNVLQIDGAPHDWLFQQVDAAVHHGGCGTTGASLRAGIPTVIKPFFGDQYFFASRVEDLGCGIHLRKLNGTVLARALWTATHDTRMIKRARLLGDEIRTEDGVGTAIKAIYRDMEYAKTLIKRRATQADDSEESWTFIGDESDPEIQRHLAEYNAAVAQAAASGAERDPGQAEMDTALSAIMMNAANKHA